MFYATPVEIEITAKTRSRVRLDFIRATYKDIRLFQLRCLSRGLETGEVLLTFMRLWAAGQIVLPGFDE